MESSDSAESENEGNNGSNQSTITQPDEINIKIDFQVSDSDVNFQESMIIELKTLIVKTLRLIAKSKDLDTHGCLEKNYLISIIVAHDLKDEEVRRIKNHKKCENPIKYSVPLSA